MSQDISLGQLPEFTQGDFLRKAREFAGLTPAELGERMGISAKTVNNAENNRHAVRPITFNAWALATGVPVQWLKTGTVTTEDDGGDGGVSGTPTRNPRPRDYKDEGQVICLRPSLDWDHLEDAA